MTAPTGWFPEIQTRFYVQNGSDGHPYFFGVAYWVSCDGRAQSAAWCIGPHGCVHSGCKE